MKKVTSVFILLAAALLFVPNLYAQDLSKYRAFSLGASLQQISKQIGRHPTDADVIQANPAVIQELTWYPPAESDEVQTVVFSFYNGILYKMLVTYDSSSTEGLTSDDMVRAISTIYGVATLPAVDNTSRTGLAYQSPEATIAHWEDAQYLLTLSRGSFFSAFQLAIYTKQMNGQAESSIAAAATEEKANAPQIALARAQKAATDLETTRQTNMKAFRP